MAALPSKDLHTLAGEAGSYFKIALSVDCAIFGFDDRELKVLLTRSDTGEFKNQWTLLGDMVQLHEDPDQAASRVMKKRTGLRNLYLEQVHTFGRPERQPLGRVVTIAYYALVNIGTVRLSAGAPDLDWRGVDDVRQIAFDHRLILENCLRRLRTQGVDRHLAFGLLPPKFSLAQLQAVYEAIEGHPLDRRNFRKKILAMDILEDLREMEKGVPHRPGRLYRFRGLIPGTFF